MPRKPKTLTHYEAIGRRKSAVAQVRLYIAPKASKATSHLSKGDILVNNMPAKEYFTFAAYHSMIEEPLRLLDSVDRFAISILANGGGKKSQLDAVRLGLSRALEQADPENRAVLKPARLLSRDSRVRERRKPGTGGRARRKKQSPKR